MMKLDRYVSRLFKDLIFHIRIDDWIASVILATHAEHDAYFGEHLSEKEQNVCEFSYSLVIRLRRSQGRYQSRRVNAVNLNSR